METTPYSRTHEVFDGSFNFLASLINGNSKMHKGGAVHHTFNFLASLINGNCCCVKLDD